MVYIYLDDGVCAVSGKETAIEASQFVQDTLAKAGFVAHPTKSNWEPVQWLQWPGFVIDTDHGHIEVPLGKIASLRQRIEQAVSSDLVSAKLLASIIGRIISMGLGIGPISRFMTHSMYAVLEARQAWRELLRLSPEAQDELSFWLACAADYKVQPIWYAPSAVRVVYSDASDTGYGGYVVEHGACVAYGQWSAKEALQSSTWRELTAVWLVLLSVADKLVNTCLRWFTDSQNVVRILQVGSKQPQLQAIAVKIFSLVVQHQMRLEPGWVPREYNEQADYLSRIVDSNDWQLQPAVFAELDALWDPHTVDRFASFCNSRLPRFNSCCWNPVRRQ